jgi:hypothetical protein
VSSLVTVKAILLTACSHEPDKLKSQQTLKNGKHQTNFNASKHLSQRPPKLSNKRKSNNKNCFQWYQELWYMHVKV